MDAEPGPTSVAAGCRPDHAVLLEHDAIRKSLDDFRTSYVARWTPEQMRADWAGYRLAQKEKCRLLRNSMKFERGLVTQLLFVS